MRHLFLNINPECLEAMIKKQNDLYNTGGKNIIVSTRKAMLAQKVVIEFIVECDHFHLGHVIFHILSNGEIINLAKKN
jgi:hypothetical protein